MLTAILTGIGISAVNTAIGFAVIFYAYNKQWGTFSRLVVGSVTVRFFALAAAVWYCISILSMDSLPLALSFSSSTFLLIMIEIIFINSKFRFIKIEQSINTEKENHYKK